MICIQLDLHVLCRCVKDDVDYDDYIMFLLMQANGFWELYFINSHEGLIFILVLDHG